MAANNSKRVARPRKRVKRDERTSITTTVPAATGMIITRNRFPRINTLRSGSIVVTNTERLLSILTVAAAGAGTRSDLTPSNLTWLNGVAVNYSKWRWLKLHLVYVPACPTATLGSLAFAYSYDTNDAIAGITMEMVQATYKSVTTPVWGGFSGSGIMNSDTWTHPPGSVVMELDTKRLDKPWYKYATATQLVAMSAVEQDAYIPASLFRFAEGGPAVVALAGYIMAKYEIELIEPVSATLND